MKKVTSLLVCLFALTLSAGTYAQWGAGWTIPPGADKEKSPLKPTPDVLTKGKAVFEARCRRCHGPEGKGDGPESDAANPAADLTDSFRVDLNPDGVMFHRVASGKPPIMPAFKSELTNDEIWLVVEYAKSLRKP